MEMIRVGLVILASLFDFGRSQLFVIARTDSDVAISNFDAGHWRLLRHFVPRKDVALFG